MSRFRFRPRIVPTLAAAVLLPIFVALGIWQTHRAEFKRELQAEYDTRIAGPVVAIEPRLQAADALRFRRVLVRGTYESDRQFFVDNRVHRGVAGFHVVTPLRIAGGDVRVLVNRGWIAGNPDRSQLPSADVPPSEVEVTGIAIVPASGQFTLGKPPAAGGAWESVWPHLDLERFAKSVPYPVQPVIVLLDPASAAGGFVREWARLDAGIKTHQSYAFQWYSLAVAVAAVYLLVHFRHGEKRS
jgi:surfeit locus 1 family protein